MANRQYAKILLKELKSVGIRGTVDWSGRHPRICFLLGDRPVKFIFPNSPSDRRSLANSRADLRFILRDHGFEPKVKT